MPLVTWVFSLKCNFFMKVSSCFCSRCFVRHSVQLFSCFRHNYNKHRRSLSLHWHYFVPCFSAVVWFDKHHPCCKITSVPTFCQLNISFVPIIPCFLLFPTVASILFLLGRVQVGMMPLPAPSCSPLRPSAGNGRRSAALSALPQTDAGRRRQRKQAERSLREAENVVETSAPVADWWLIPPHFTSSGGFIIETAINVSSLAKSAAGSQSWFDWSAAQLLTKPSKSLFCFSDPSPKMWCVCNPAPLPHPGCGKEYFGSAPSPFTTLLFACNRSEPDRLLN